MGDKIRATDDEALASELWGDDKEWDDERKQFVPTGDEDEGGEQSSHGSKSEKSSDVTESNAKPTSSARPSTVPTTEQHSSKDPKGSTTAPSTAGSGKAKQ